MIGILRSLYCMPCLWTLLCGLSLYFVSNYIRNNWVPFRGPTPSDGPVNGFASKADEIQFYDTHDLRIQTTWKYGVIIAVVWAIGAGLAFIILKGMGQ